LGSGVNGALDIKRHPWFQRVDWDAILNKQIRPPFIPKIKNEIDVSCFDDEFVSGEVQSVSENGSLRGKDYPGILMIIIF